MPHKNSNKTKKFLRLKGYQGFSVQDFKVIYYLLGNYKLSIRIPTVTCYSAKFRLPITVCVVTQSDSQIISNVWNRFHQYLCKIWIQKKYYVIFFFIINTKKKQPIIMLVSKIPKSRGSSWQHKNLFVCKRWLVLAAFFLSFFVILHSSFFNL